VAIDHVRDLDLGHTSGQRYTPQEQSEPVSDRRFVDRGRTDQIA
jgi:hypothetical protein